MNLSFNTIDKILNKLPKDINNIIFSFYDTKCNKCNEYLILCNECKLYFCKYYICFNHHISCSVCNGHQCPFKIFYEICDCHNNKLCKICFFRDNQENLSIMIIDDILSFSDDYLYDSLENEINQ